MLLRHLGEGNDLVRVEWNDPSEEILWKAEAFQN